MVDLTEEYDNDEKWAKDKNIMPGGSWAPNCNAVFDIALVVPFRNRYSYPNFNYPFNLSNFLEIHNSMYFCLTCTGFSKSS